MCATKWKCLRAFDFIIAFVAWNARDSKCRTPRIATLLYCSGSHQNENKREITEKEQAYIVQSTRSTFYRMRLWLGSMYTTYIHIYIYTVDRQFTDWNDIQSDPIQFPRSERIEFEIYNLYCKSTFASVRSSQIKSIANQIHSTECESHESLGFIRSHVPSIPNLSPWYDDDSGEFHVVALPIFFFFIFCFALNDERRNHRLPCKDIIRVIIFVPFWHIVKTKHILLFIMYLSTLYLTYSSFISRSFSLFTAELFTWNSLFLWLP